MSVFEGVQRVVFAHAHPDDETLATGALIQHLTRSGVAVAVVTATRGELGAVVPGPLSALEGTPELEPHRVGELTAALRALGAGNTSAEELEQIKLLIQQLENQQNK